METEIKLALASASQGRIALRKAGFRVVRRRVHEDNLVFDTPRGDLRKTGKLLRLRAAGRLAIITFKGPSLKHKYKSRMEIETAVGNPDAARGILGCMGLKPVFRYEKFRTEYRGEDARGHVCLDETPVGAFLELEGPANWIEATAKLLGFDESAFITCTYARLHRLSHKLLGLPPEAMIFPGSCT
jgi:adenylate cyclase class 2